MEVDRKVSLYKKKNKNLSNYQGPNHSIYQAPVLYQVQSGLQAIAYFNLQTSTSNSAPISMTYGFFIYSIPNTFHVNFNTRHDSRHAAAEVSVSN